MASFVFQPNVSDGESAARHAGDAGMGGEILLHDARWFTQIRWAVIVSLLGLGLAGILCPAALAERFGFVLPVCGWPFILSLVLVLLNLLNLGWLATVKEHTPDAAIVANLWFQIVCDLVVLTVLAYFMGLTDTPIAFAFLFHIVLACIFFGRRDSFLVTLIGTVLFVGAVVLAATGALPRCSILKLGGCGGNVAVVVHTGFTVFVWLVVWYLASSISDMVRRRDFELAAANERLQQADEEKNRHMLRVTHDLKAPFSGIENFIQALKFVHWEELPEDARAIIGKIEARSTTLRARIGEILTLGRLRSDLASGSSHQAITLNTLLADIVDELEGLAAEKDVTIVLDAMALSVESDPRQLKILFMNLVSNAISYSQDHGKVEVSVREGKQIAVDVRDYGIGIREDALPHVFEDFYRSKEAARFNPKSTGLGLAAVRQVAENLGLTIGVESQEGEGTLFCVQIPRL